MDDVVIHADAHVKRVRVLDIAYGHDLDDGAFDLDVTKDGLSLKGRGAIAAIPLTVTGSMDFNTGPPDQVVQKIVATGQPDAAQLDAAGLHVTDVIDGPVPLTAVLVERRNGNGSVTLNSDLTLATLTFGTLAWSKPSGSAATATATLLLSHDRLSRIDRLSVRGDDLLLTGSAEFADGQIRSLMLDRMKLGRTDGRGAVHFAANKPIGIVLRGGQLDLGPKLAEKSGDKPAPDGPVTPAWTLDGRFDRALLANGEQAANLLVKAAGDGETIRTLDVVGALGTGAGFTARIEPRDGKRHLRVTSQGCRRFPARDGCHQRHAIRSTDHRGRFHPADRLSAADGFGGYPGCDSEEPAGAGQTAAGDHAVRAGGCAARPGDGVHRKSCCRSSTTADRCI